MKCFGIHSFSQLNKKHGKYIENFTWLIFIPLLSKDLTASRLEYKEERGSFEDRAKWGVVIKLLDTIKLRHHVK